MPPGHPDVQPDNSIITKRTIRRRSRHSQANRHAAGRNLADPVIRTGGFAVGAHPDREGASGGPCVGGPCLGSQRGRTGGVGTRHQQAAGADPAGEGGEGRLDLRQAGIVVQVIRFDAGDDRRLRREHEERAVALVRLGDEEVTAALVGAQPGPGQDAADDV